MYKIVFLPQNNTYCYFFYIFASKLQLTYSFVNKSVIFIKNRDHIKMLKNNREKKRKLTHILKNNN